MTAVLVLGTALTLIFSVCLGIYLADCLWHITGSSRFLFIAAFSIIAWAALVILGIVIVWPTHF
ncbi:MAG: hypothetical protein ACYC2T_09130 [Bacillota bacterium]